MVIVGKKIFAVSISVVSTSIFVRVVVNRGCQRGAIGTTYGYAETGIIIAVVYLGRESNAFAGMLILRPIGANVHRFEKNYQED